ncbi:S8 family serine peptidase [Bdellovibrio bacteriovorus]|uniref:S8 family peptidase n=1 Tax=Bdellovibrio bacteriovorus TaxID=959 RepID=UPI0035A58E20
MAVIDSGVSLPDSYDAQILPGWDAFDNDTTPEDSDGHGTAVAGIILSLAPKAQIIPLRAFDQGMGYIAAAIDGFKFAVDHGASIVNCSFTLSEDILREMRESVGRERFNKTLLIWASGNQSSQLPDFEESWPNVIVVGATNLTSPISRVFYSNTGSVVDVLAPAGDPGDGLTTWTPQGDYRTFNGTSGAAPVVAALAVLYKEQNPAASPAAIRRAIVESSCRGVVNSARLLRISEVCPAL